MLKITAETIEHNKQRYPTLGDYIGHEGLRFVQISEMGNSWYEYLIAMHELDEQAWCIKNGIPEDLITKFDIAFEKSDRKGEPGDDPECPYFHGHQFATAMEKLRCENLGLDWNAYGRYLTEFVNGKEKE